MATTQDEPAVVPADQVEKTLHFLYEAGYVNIGYHTGATIMARGLWAIGLILMDVRSILKSIEREGRRR